MLLKGFSQLMTLTLNFSCIKIYNMIENKLTESIMKRLNLVLMLMLISILTSMTSIAQVRFGIQGGLSVPNLSGGNNEISQGYTSRLAPNFGITAEIAVTKKFSIEPQVNFDGQGGQRNGLQPITSTNLPPLPSGGYYYANFKSTSILNYIEVPVLAKYKFGFARLGLHVNAGPFVGILLNATDKTSGTSSIYIDKNGTPLVMPDGNGGYVPLPPQSFDASNDVTSSLHAWNIGVAGGVGVILPVSPRANLSLDVRGLYGLINVQKYAEDGTNHTGNLIFSIGYSRELFGI